MEELRKKQGFICDMDGVIYHGNKLLPGVKEFVDWLYSRKEELSLPDELVRALASRSCSRSCGAWDWRSTRAISIRARSPPRASSASQAPGCSAYVIGGAGLIVSAARRGHQP